MWAALARGDPGHLISPFDLEAFFKMIEREKLQRSAMVPPIILAAIRSPLFKKYDLSSIIKVGTGAAPIGPDLQKEASEAFNVNLTQVWGMSETTGVATHASPTEPPAYGSCGKILAGLDLRIVRFDEQGNAVNQPPNKEGEIWIRGGTVTEGYLENDKANKESFLFDERHRTGENKDRHWFRTGDIAYVNDEGFIYIVDREKDLIKYKGLQVAPAELEDIVLTHPAVLDAAVIGIWNEAEVTEVPMAFIVKRPNVTTPDSELSASVAAHVAKVVSGYKKLRGGVRIIDAIPKGPSGKILRRELKDLIKKEQASVSTRSKL